MITTLEELIDQLQGLRVAHGGKVPVIAAAPPYHRASKVITCLQVSEISGAVIVTVG